MKTCWTVDSAIRALGVSDREIRASARHFLNSCASEEVVEGINRALDGSSISQREQTIEELVGIDAASSVLVLRLLEDPAPGVRRLCAGRLTGQECGAREAFIRALADTNDGVVRMACLRLSQIGGAEVLPALKEATRHPSWHVQWRACNALFELDAVDAELLKVVESLQAREEAQEHDTFLRRWRELKLSGEDDQPLDLGLTPSELLAAVSRRLDSEGAP